jgi:hypothetical protein
LRSGPETERSGKNVTEADSKAREAEFPELPALPGAILQTKVKKVEKVLDILYSML